MVLPCAMNAPVIADRLQNPEGKLTGTVNVQLWFVKVPVVIPRVQFQNTYSELVPTLSLSWQDSLRLTWDPLSFENRERR